MRSVNGGGSRKISLSSIDIVERTDYPTFQTASNTVRSIIVKGYSVRHLKDFLRAMVLAGTVSGLIGCEEEQRIEPKPVLETKQNSPVKESTPAEEKTTADEQTSQEEQIITAVEIDSPPGPVADNNLCFACHVNFKKEALTSIHAQANIGCTRCHGTSIAHCSDENTLTPPDVMFPKAKIKSFCSDCHTGDSMHIPAHESVIAEPDPLKACCTDCHGEHRLNYRTRQWDKITRNLIKDRSVRRLSDEIFEQK